MDGHVFATRARFVARAGPRGGTTLVFALNRPRRLVVQVLGQAPGCRVLGSFTRRGSKGLSRVRFDGRLGGTALRPGTYTLVPYALSRQNRQQLASVTVQIVPAHRALTAAERRGPLGVQCSSAVGGRGTGTAVAVSSPLDSTSRAAVAGRTVRGSGKGVASASTTRRTLGAKLDSAADLPVLSAIIPEDAPVPPSLLAVLALIAIGLGSFALVASLIRFMRGNWNP